MTRLLLALLLLLALPVAAHARPGDPDRRFGRQGTVTLKATSADAVGGAVKVLSGNRILAGGSAGGQFVVVRLRKTGTLDSRFGTGGQVVPALPGTSLDGVRALATFRDGRIVAAGTLRLADGTTRMVALRMLPTGEIDPSFGAGLGYVQVGPPGAVLGAMVMDRFGNVILGGSRPNAGAEVPIVTRLLPDGTTNTDFAGTGTFEAASLGLGGRVTSLLARPDGALLFTVGGTETTAYPATFSIVRLLPTGTPDPAFAGTGLANIPLGANGALTGLGVGAQAIRTGPGGRFLVAGTDLTETSTPRGAVIRLRPDGSLDPRFGRRGVTRISRKADEIRITAMVRDNQGRIVLSGSGRPPNALVVRLRGNGARDRGFGNGGITFPRLGRPPGGQPIYTTLTAVDAAGSRAVIAGSAAGPGVFVRGLTGTTYTGRFALTVTKLR
jgi:uncharacterized delta-60 repeat protein